VQHRGFLFRLFYVAGSITSAITRRQRTVSSASKTKLICLKSQFFALPRSFVSAFNLHPTVIVIPQCWSFILEMTQIWPIRC